MRKLNIIIMIFLGSILNSALSGTHALAKYDMAVRVNGQAAMHGPAFAERLQSGSHHKIARYGAAAETKAVAGRSIRQPSMQEHTFMIRETGASADKMLGRAQARQVHAKPVRELSGKEQKTELLRRAR